jgi:hypothetical protein
MELSLLSLPLPASRSVSLLPALKRNPCRTKAPLSSVVKEIKTVLKSGTGIYLCNPSASYAHRICSIRVASFGDFLRVKTDYGWSTVWYSECLVDESGRVLYSTMPVDEWIVSLVEDLGILPLPSLR